MGARLPILTPGPAPAERAVPPVDHAAAEARLKELLGACPKVLVAFSGGIDSAYLLAVAVQVLGDRALALTALSDSLPAEEREDARRIAAEIGVSEYLLLDSHELEREGYRTNPVNRCYFCKTELYDICAREAARLGIDTVVDGVNLDDLGDHRPGLTAAAEHGVRHLLVEAGFSKAAIRTAAKARGLSAWDKPAFACLASRFPHGTPITAERLSRVEQMESLLRRLSFRQFRVRFHDEIARIELDPTEIPRAASPEIREPLVALGKELGFRFVTLDLLGYRMGSMNPTEGA